MFPSIRYAVSSGTRTRPKHISPFQNTLRTVRANREPIIKVSAISFLHPTVNVNKHTALSTPCPRVCTHTGPLPLCDLMSKRNERATAWLSDKPVLVVAAPEAKSNQHRLFKGEEGHRSLCGMRIETENPRIKRPEAGASTSVEQYFIPGNGLRHTPRRKG